MCLYERLQPKKAGALGAGMHLVAVAHAFRGCMRRQRWRVVFFAADFFGAVFFAADFFAAGFFAAGFFAAGLAEAGAAGENRAGTGDAVVTLSGASDVDAGGVGCGLDSAGGALGGGA